MIYISGNVPSSKNSKEFITQKNGKKYLINSKTVERYIKNSSSQWLINKTKFLKMLEGKNKPYIIQFYFVRDSLRKFDYINACQLPCDLMVKYGWIDDDNANEIIPVFMGYEKDKNKAGVYIDIGQDIDNKSFMDKLKQLKAV